MYKARWVPVGIDQVPHVELTREVARRFNNTFGELFPEPEAKLTEIPKVPGTDGRKMSKSYNNTIDLADTAETIIAKVRPMVTDPARRRRTARLHERRRIPRRRARARPHASGRRLRRALRSAPASLPHERDRSRRLADTHDH